MGGRKDAVAVAMRQIRWRAGFPSAIAARAKQHSGATMAEWRWQAIAEAEVRERARRRGWSEHLRAAYARGGGELSGTLWVGLRVSSTVVRDAAGSR
jgi:hypothetical protein